MLYHVTYAMRECSASISKCTPTPGSLPSVISLLLSGQDRSMRSIEALAVQGTVMPLQRFCVRRGGASVDCARRTRWDRGMWGMTMLQVMAWTLVGLQWDCWGNVIITEVASRDDPLTHSLTLINTRCIRALSLSLSHTHTHTSLQGIFPDLAAIQHHLHLAL